MQDSYRLDRTRFSILSFSEADKDNIDHSQLSWQERCRIHQYLNAIAYSYAGKEAPRMDKTILSYRKIGDGKHFLS
ncbi:MAG: hypothetical protein SGI96_07950 [Bacteroidota bacterium]|nr:hypothetical protein [Chitinophagaceae bacterium]MDZ4808191.1 hypothetical protein [Bacteroidota bacterium]